MTEAGRRLAWLLSLGLLAAGNVVAHALTYRIVEPEHEARAHLLEQTGHGYLDLDLVLSLCVALVAVGFLGRVLSGTAGDRAPSLWIFALAPPVGFAVQEHAERILHHEAIATYALEPTFLVGLALQLPFAFVAYLAARALLAAAEALARHIGSPPRSRPAPDASLATPGTSFAPRGPVLLGGRGQRAPPALLVS